MERTHLQVRLPKICRPLPNQTSCSVATRPRAGQLIAAGMSARWPCRPLRDTLERPLLTQSGPSFIAALRQEQTLEPRRKSLQSRPRQAGARCRDGPGQVVREDGGDRLSRGKGYQHRDGPGRPRMAAGKPYKALMVQGPPGEGGAMGGAGHGAVILVVEKPLKLTSAHGKRQISENQSRRVSWPFHRNSQESPPAWGLRMFNTCRTWRRIFIRIGGLLNCI